MSKSTGGGRLKRDLKRPIERLQQRKRSQKGYCEICNALKKQKALRNDSRGFKMDASVLMSPKTTAQK